MTIGLYIAKSFSIRLLAVFLICSGITLFFDTIELTRVMSNSSIRHFTHIISMAAMKNYTHFQKIWLFIILITSILTYYKLARGSELTAMKAMGMSSWIILSPAIFVSIIIGIIHFAVLNPISASLMGRYQHIEASSFAKGQKSLINLSKSGLWLKTEEKDYLKIIHGTRLSPKTQEIFDFSIYSVTHAGKFINRIDATKAKLDGSTWHLTDAITVDNNYNKQVNDSLEIPAKITFSQISANMTPPSTISFWHMPRFINLAQNSGFWALHYKLYFLQLLLSPLLFASITLFGYNFGALKTRSDKHGQTIFIGVCIGFIIYFLGDFISALSLSGATPISIAALIPIMFFTMIGCYLLLHNEF